MSPELRMNAPPLLGGPSASSEKSVVSAEVITSVCMVGTESAVGSTRAAQNATFAPMSIGRNAAAGALAILIPACVRPRIPVTASSRSPTTHAAFIVRLGNDTIMVERYATANGVTRGDIVDRSPKTTVLHYEFTTDGDRVVHLTAIQRATGADSGSAPLWTVTSRYVRGGFDIVVQEKDSAYHRFISAPSDAIPVFARSVALDEVMTRRLRRTGADSISVIVLDLDTTASRVTIRTLGADSVVIPVIFPRGEHARVDATGNILGVSGLATSYKWLTERVDDLDIAALARSFTQRDAKGQALGAYSSRDTARAVIDGAHIAIDYGRPAKRGRAIFGALVPWGEVWRTGADLATHLTTDRALQFDGLVVPAGTYSLYTLPTPSRWTLIVNRRTGQIGLMYDRSADLGRVDMTAAHTSALTERLTISIEPTLARGGAVRIAWDDVVVTAPFVVVTSTSPRPH